MWKVCTALLYSFSWKYLGVYSQNSLSPTCIVRRMSKFHNQWHKEPLMDAGKVQSVEIISSGNDLLTTWLRFAESWASKFWEVLLMWDRHSVGVAYASCVLKHVIGSALGLICARLCFVATLCFSLCCVRDVDIAWSFFHIVYLY